MQGDRKKIKAVLFDLGYTLIYFQGDFSQTVFDSYLVLADHLKELGCDIDRQSFAERFSKQMNMYYQKRDVDLLELPVDSLVEQVLSELGQKYLPAKFLREAMNKMYLATESHWHIEEDTYLTLKTLTRLGFKLGLISNASDSWDVNNLINNHKLRPYFSTILISADEGIRKPNPKLFLKAASEMGVTPSETVMVGDTIEADVLGAHQCGMKAIWISRRKEMPDILADDPSLRPDAEIKTLQELPEVLQHWM